MSLLGDDEKLFTTLVMMCGKIASLASSCTLVEKLTGLALTCRRSASEEDLSRSLDSRRISLLAQDNKTQL